MTRPGYITIEELRAMEAGKGKTNKNSLSSALEQIAANAVMTGKIKGEMLCEGCGQSVPRSNHKQKYCLVCSEAKDLKRKKLAKTTKTKYGERRGKLQRKGLETSKLQASSIAWMVEESPDLLWLIRFKFPFDYAISKNHIYTTRQNGHVALRAEHRHMREVLGLAIQNALKDQKVVQNKVWLDILVQKPNHKGDAINVIDAIADVIKHAIEVDDRWFCIRRLDWEIVKENPQIFIGIGQDSDIAVQICSFCGQMLEFDKFSKNKSNKNGITRDCIDCRKLLR